MHADVTKLRRVLKKSCRDQRALYTFAEQSRGAPSHVPTTITWTSVEPASVRRSAVTPLLACDFTTKRAAQLLNIMREIYIISSTWTRGAIPAGARSGLGGFVWFFREITKRSAPGKEIYLSCWGWGELMESQLSYRCLLFTQYVDDISGEGLHARANFTSLNSANTMVSLFFSVKSSWPNCGSSWILSGSFLFPCFKWKHPRLLFLLFLSVYRSRQHEVRKWQKKQMAWIIVLF